MKALTTTSTFSEQRELLCLQLQQNRRVIAHMLTDSGKDFPRSFTMRLFTKNKPAVGLRLFRFISYGFSFLSLIKRRSSSSRHIERAKTR